MDGSYGASGEELLEVGVWVGVELGLGALPLYLALVEQYYAIGGAAEGAGDGVESGGGFVVEEELVGGLYGRTIGGAGGWYTGGG